MARPLVPLAGEHRLHLQVGSAPLTAPCPATVVRSAETKGTAITRTIHATDGGSATLTVGPIRIDKTKPTLTIQGVTSGQSYKHAPTLKCVAHDPLSGVASCVISKHQHGQVVQYSATATDVAGNATTKTGNYRLT